MSTDGIECCRPCLGRSPTGFETTNEARRCYARVTEPESCSALLLTSSYVSRTDPGSDSVDELVAAVDAEFGEDAILWCPSTVRTETTNRSAI